MLGVESYIIEFTDQLQFHNLNDFHVIAAELEMIATALGSKLYTPSDVHHRNKANLLAIANLPETVFPTPDPLPSEASAAQQQEHLQYVRAHQQFVSEFIAHLKKFIVTYVEKLRALEIGEKLALIAKQQTELPRMQFQKVLSEIQHVAAKSKFAAAAVSAASRPTTSLDESFKAQLISQGIEPDLFATTTNAPERDLCALLLNIHQNPTLATSTDLYQTLTTCLQQHLGFTPMLTEPSLSKISEYSRSVFKLFAGSWIKIDEFKAMPTEYQAYLIDNSSEIVELISKYGLEANTITKFELESLDDIIFYKNNLPTILSKTEIAINDLPELDKDSLHSLLTNAHGFMFDCASCGLTLRELFNQPIKLQLLLANPQNLQKIKTLINYFNIPKKTILELDQNSFVNILKNPTEYAIYMFNSASPAYSAEKLATALSKFNATIKHECKELLDSEFLIHVFKMRGALAALKHDLQSAGLKFQQMRCIYEVFAQQLLAFNQALVAKHMHNTTTHLPEWTDTRDLQISCNERDVALVQQQAQECKAMLTSTLQNSKSTVTDTITKTCKLATGISKIVNEDAYVTRGIVALTDQLYTVRQQNNNATYKIMHLKLLGHLMKSKIGANLSQVKHNKKFMEFISNIETSILENATAAEGLAQADIASTHSAALSSYCRFYANMFHAYKDVIDVVTMHEYMPRTGVADENKLFQAVLSCDTDTLCKLLGQGANVFDCNNRGVSLLSCAYLTQNTEVIRIVRDAIRKQGKVFHHCIFGAATEIEPARMHIALFEAIRSNSMPKVEYLLAHGCSLESPDTDGLTPLAYAEKLQRGTIAQQLFIQLTNKLPLHRPAASFFHMDA